MKIYYQIHYLPKGGKISIISGAVVGDGVQDSRIYLIAEAFL